MRSLMFIKSAALLFDQIRRLLIHRWRSFKYPSVCSCFASLPVSFALLLCWMITSVPRPVPLPAVVPQRPFPEIAPLPLNMQPGGDMKGKIKVRLLDNWSHCRCDSLQPLNRANNICVLMTSKVKEKLSIASLSFVVPLKTSCHWSTIRENIAVSVSVCCIFFLLTLTLIIHPAEFY